MKCMLRLLYGWAKLSKREIADEIAPFGNTFNIPLRAKLAVCRFHGRFAEVVEGGGLADGGEFVTLFSVGEDIFLHRFVELDMQRFFLISIEKIYKLSLSFF